MEFTFYPYTGKNVDKVDERWGVYKLADHSKHILFIGRGNVKRHLYDHLPEGKAPADGAEFFSIEYYESHEEAMEAWNEQIESFKGKFGDLPRYNR